MSRETGPVWLRNALWGIVVACAVVSPAVAREVVIPCLVGGGVADADGDGFGDNAMALPGPVPGLAVAGVDLTGGDGQTGTARLQFEWEIPPEVRTHRLLSATVVLSTFKGSVDVLDTFFFRGSADQDGELLPGDFEAPADALPGVVMPVVDGASQFTIDVTDWLRADALAGRGFFSLQGRVDESLAGSGSQRGLQVYTTAEATPLALRPQLVVQLAPVISWAGAMHQTLPGGTQIDSLDVGFSSLDATLADKTITVDGPAGFHYQFVDGDIISSGNGQIEVYHWFPSLDVGYYTFSMTDGEGNQDVRVDQHANLRTLPLVDLATVQHARLADGSYRISWAPVQLTETMYYRVQVRRSGASAYYGGRVRKNYFDVPASVFQDGVSHQYRIEVHDAPTWDQLLNRSQTDYVTFVPDPGDYDPDRLWFPFWNAYNRFEANGAQSTVVEMGFSSMADLVSVQVTGPASFSYSFDLTGDRIGGELYRAIPGVGTPGTYTFHVVANVGGRVIHHYQYATLTPAVLYPAVDPATYQVEEQADGTLRFSWAGVDWNGALYYRIYSWDALGGADVTSARRNQAFAVLSAATLGDLTGRQWRVEVFDSEEYQTVRNRRVGTWSALIPRPYDPAAPSLGSVMLRHRRDTSGIEKNDIWFGTTSPVQDIQEVRVEGPTGYLRDLVVDGAYREYPNIAGGQQGFELIELPAPSPGLYTLTAVGYDGRSTTAYDTQPQPHAIPCVDYRTIRVNPGVGGGVRVSWAPVASDLPVWYVLFLFSPTDGNGDGGADEVFSAYYLRNTSYEVPAGAMPAGPLMMQVQVRDAGNASLVSNIRPSVEVGYEGPGYAYDALVDADGDGFADNIDPNDGDPAVTPLPAPTYAIADYVGLPLGSQGLYVAEPGIAGAVSLLYERWQPLPAGVAGVLRADYMEPTGPYTSYGFFLLDGSGWSLAAVDDPDGFVLIAPPGTLISAAPVPGETRDVDLGSLGTARTRVLGVRRATVPAYDGFALAVRFEFLGGTPYAEDWFFASGIGLVKSVATNTDNGFFFGGCELTSYDVQDGDGDGVVDRVDAFPTDPAASVDTDGDGAPDAWNPGCTAACSTTGLHLDAFPTDPAASVDTDGDGHPDAWNPGKTAADSTTGLTLDAFPDDPTRWSVPGGGFLPAVEHLLLTRP